MMPSIARKLTLGALALALLTPAAFAEPLGTDPPPRLVRAILAFFGWRNVRAGRFSSKRAAGKVF